MEVRHYNEEIEKGEKSIYLAGPSLRTDWRENALRHLKTFSGIVYIPSERHNVKEISINDKFIWENEALKESTVITLWIPSNYKVFKNYVLTPQFGYWTNVGKTLYGRLDSVYSDKFDEVYKPINYQLDGITYTDLELLMRKSINWADRLFELNKNPEQIDEKVANALSITCEQYRLSDKDSCYFADDFYNNLFGQLSGAERLYETSATQNHQLGCEQCINSSCNLDTDFRREKDEDGNISGTDCIGWRNSRMTGKQYLLRPTRLQKRLNE